MVWEGTVMTVQEAYDRLKAKFPNAIEDAGERGLIVEGAQLVEIATHLRDEAGFDYLSGVFGVDYPEYFEVMYLVYSMAQKVGPVILRVRTGRESPKVPSLVPVWASANFQEREAYDLLGIKFEGHPNLKRFFLWEGFPGHPLRKDFDNRIFSFEELNRTNPEGVRYGD